MFLMVTTFSIPFSKMRGTGTGRHQATKFDEEFFGPNIMFNSAREVEELTWN